MGGGLPRVPYAPDQLEALVFSICDPEHFASLPEGACSDLAGAVVFLRAPETGWISAAALSLLAGLDSFVRFERGLAGLQGPFSDLPVEKTTGLFSSPGSVVLHGEA